MPLQIPQVSPPMPPSNNQYPATTKQAAAMIDGLHTNATSTLFSDKIMMTITQDGRLAQWVHKTPTMYSLYNLIYAKAREYRSMSLWTLPTPTLQTSTSLQMPMAMVFSHYPIFRHIRYLAAPHRNVRRWVSCLRLRLPAGSSQGTQRR